MGVAEKINWVDSNCWNGTVFDGGWNTRLADQQDVLEPATGQLLWRVGVASAADMTTAIERAHAAQASWAATSPRERAAIMLKAAALFERHFDELSLMIARETGGIIPKGQHEVRESVVLCQLAAAMPMQAQGELLPSTPGRLSIARRVPHGVVGVISPFNFPLILSLRSVAPALALGNAVVLKPDVRTPASGGFILARIFQEAGLPAGVLQVLPGNAEAGEALVTDPRVPMIAFTGSPGVGRRIGELGGKHLKKVSLELGGANNLIILEDADLDAAASAAAEPDRCAGRSPPDRRAGTGARRAAAPHRRSRSAPPRRWPPPWGWRQTACPAGTGSNPEQPRQPASSHAAQGKRPG